MKVREGWGGWRVAQENGHNWVFPNFSKPQGRPCGEGLSQALKCPLQSRCPPASGHCGHPQLPAARALRGVAAVEGPGRRPLPDLPQTPAGRWGLGSAAQSHSPSTGCSEPAPRFPLRAGFPDQGAAGWGQKGRLQLAGRGRGKAREEQSSRRRSTWGQPQTGLRGRVHKAREAPTAVDEPWGEKAALAFPGLPAHISPRGPRRQVARLHSPLRPPPSAQPGPCHVPRARDSPPELTPQARWKLSAHLGGSSHPRGPGTGGKP